MENKNVDIEELIADAKAEEEVRKGQPCNDFSFREELESHLKEAFSDIKARRESKVTIDLNEYLILKFKERDLERIVATILDKLTLNHDKSGLWIYDHEDDISNIIKVLYPEVYQDVLYDLQEKEKKENN
jgi:hypothetical protein